MNNKTQGGGIMKCLLCFEVRYLFSYCYCSVVSKSYIKHVITETDFINFRCLAGIGNWIMNAAATNVAMSANACGDIWCIYTYSVNSKIYV